MSKKKQREKDASATAPPSIDIGTILEHLSSVKDNSKSFIDGSNTEDDKMWVADVAACEAATAIITALQDEGINDPEQVRDLVQDYNTQAKQYQTMHQKYEVPVRPKNVCGIWVCPDCNRQMRPGNKYCWNCGKRLGW